MSETREILQQGSYDSVRRSTYIALDYPSAEAALALVTEFGEAVDGYKIGLELFHRAGPEIVRRVAALGKRIFLDVKLHDIPNTVAGALRAIADLPVEMVNVHAFGGRDMLLAAKEALVGARHKVQLIAVTALTSLADDDLDAIGVALPLPGLVERLVDLTVACGLDGVVASAQETAVIRQRTGAGFQIVVPGTRPLWAQANDQKRIATPRAALAAGATQLVIGRAVTQSANPVESLKRLWDEVLKEDETDGVY